MSKLLVQLVCTISPWHFHIHHRNIQRIIYNRGFFTPTTSKSLKWNWTPRALGKKDRPVYQVTLVIVVLYILVSSSLNPAPTQINPTGIRGAINFTLIFFFLSSWLTKKLIEGGNLGSWISVCNLNRIKTNDSTSKQHRKLKFGVKSYFNPNKSIKKKIGSPTLPPAVCIKQQNKDK